MRKKVPTISKRYLTLALVVILLLLVVSISFMLFYYLFNGRIYQGVSLNNVEVSRLTIEEASAKLKQNFQMPENIKILLSGKNGETKEFDISTQSIRAHYKYDEAVQSAFRIARGGSTFSDAKAFFATLFNGNDSTIKLGVDEELLYEQVSIIASQVDDPPKKASLSMVLNEVHIEEGSDGYLLDVEKAITTIKISLATGSENIKIAPVYIKNTLTEAQIEKTRQFASSLIGKSLEATLENEYSKKFTDAEMLQWIDPYKAIFDQTLILPHLDDLSKNIDREPSNPVFVFEDNKVKEFSPSKEGLKVDTVTLAKNLAMAATELATDEIDEIVVPIAVETTEPPIKTGEVNDLGIKELIGVGTSSYKGSIPSRVFNVSHAAGKLNGVLIKPGETFSFVNTLGDISALTGYKQAYIIQGNQTILGDGGGVCQVSTTFFRAVLDAGLPIVERHAHSYRVGYYEQDSPPGIDATIYHPTVDIKIKNDTPGHILIQTIADSKNMTLKFELYGTSDGRVSEISKPVTSSVSAPPEDLYIDDPTLPTGQIKQIDYKAWGAKVNFNYKVTKNGETLFEETYYSNYKPWQAKFLRGTGPIQ